MPATRCPQGYRAVYNFWHGPFPDVHMTVDHLFSDGDYVGAHWQVRGTHTGDFFGTPPTGKQVDVSVTGIFRCRNGKIAEGWVNPDRFGLMQQLGIVKAPDMSRRRAAQKSSHADNSESGPVFPAGPLLGTH